MLGATAPESSQTTVRITQAFDAYTSKVAQVHAYRLSIRRAADAEVARLHEQRDAMVRAGQPPSSLISSQNMAFRTAETGKPYFYAFKDAAVQDLISSLVERTNREYQWLLVEAYELFEDFLKQAYACVGYADKNAWPLKDFGNVSLSELSSKDFSYFLEQSRNKKNVPYSILSQLRQKSPHISRIERDNNLHANLYLAVALIEKMRHFIVHARGIVVDKDRFRKDVLEKAGLYNNAKPSTESIDFMSSFFLLSNEGSIWLLDIPGWEFRCRVYTIDKSQRT